MKRILLIDGHNLLFRMFYGIPSSIKNKDGKEIKGLVGFIGSLKKLVSEFAPYSLYVIFDSETSKVANLGYDTNYKANRKDFTNIPEEENPFTQLPYIKEALTYLEIPYFEVQNNEADDYIASIIKRNKQKDIEFIIVSTDTDFFQLLDENTYLYVPHGKKSILYVIENFKEKFNILPNDYVLYKSLVGDKTDNIEGIKGIGKITAVKIVYALKEEIKLETKLKETLEINKEKIIRNIHLITLNSNLDVKNITFSKLNSKLSTQKTYEIINNSNKTKISN